MSNNLALERLAVSFHRPCRVTAAPPSPSGAVPFSRNNRSTECTWSRRWPTF